MDNSSEILVEIPPPEVSPAGPNKWALIVVSLASLAAVVAFALATSPRIPAFEWEERTGPAAVNLDSLVATADGFAMLSGMTVDGVLVWSSTDGVEWHSQHLRGAPTQLAEVDEGLLAFADIEGHLLEHEGETWVEAESNIVFPDQIRSRQSSGRPSVIGTGSGMLAMSLFGDVWLSRDGADFEEVVSDPDWGPSAEIDLVVNSSCRPPSRTSPDVPPIVATDAGLVALVADNPSEPFGVWPVCDPQVWLSQDGSEWSRAGAMTEATGYVYDFAWRDGRFTAVGGYGIGEPEVWTSTDGMNWETLAFLDIGGHDLYAVAAGPAAWVILGQADEQSNRVGWTSLDGLCWETLPLEVAGSDVAVSSETVLLLDRTEYPEIQTGSVTGGTGSC